MNKPHKSRNSEPNKQSPRNIFEIFSCSWALENFSHSRGLRTDISQKTVVGCPWGKLIWFLVQHNLTSSDFLEWKKRLIQEEANIFIILLSWSSLKREHVLFSMIERWGWGTMDSRFLVSGVTHSDAMTLCKTPGRQTIATFLLQGASKQRRFWATHVNRKWTYSLLICLVASKFVLLRVFSLKETICPKICSKSSLKSAKSPLPVDARPSKWSLLFRHHQSTIVVPKKWEILCNAPSTENPWKLLITTNSLELSYPVI